MVKALTFKCGRGRTLAFDELLPDHRCLARSMAIRHILIQINLERNAARRLGEVLIHITAAAPLRRDLPEKRLHACVAGRHGEYQRVAGTGR